MKWTDIPSDTLNAAEQRLWVAFGDVADLVASKINTDPEYLARLTTYAIHRAVVDKSVKTTKVAITKTWASGLPKNEF